MTRAARLPLLFLLCLSQAAPACASASLHISDSPVTAIGARDPAATDTCSSAQSSPGELFRLGKLALKDGELARAEVCFREVLTLDPDSSAAHINLAVAYMREKRWKNALDELRQAEAISPDEPGVQLNLGLAYYRSNDFTAAIKPFSSFLRKVPDSLQARYLLGLCYFFTDRYKEATDILAPLWSQEASHLNYLYVLAIAASKSSDGALQQRAFGQMLTIGQNSPEFHLYMGKAWLAEDDTAKALKEFEAAALARPDLPLVHYFLGRTYLEQHSYPQAEAELLKDIALEPEFAYNYEDLGILYSQTDRPAEAERFFEQALERNSSLVNSCFGLAKLYRKDGKLKEALKQLDIAEALAPQSASLHYTRGQVLTALGEKAKAQLEFERSAALLNAFNQRLQQARTGDRYADAQDAAEQ